MARRRIGVIGGTGLYDMDGIQDLTEQHVDTPFGAPSDLIRLGRVGDVEVAFLARHGRGHRLTPTEVPYRANVYAMKKLGVQWLLSVSAVGSLKEEIAPGHIVLIDQFIDKTFRRVSSFFGGGVVAHAPFGDPVCPVLRGLLLEAAREAGAVVHDGGTYVCMEGPAFSTKAESSLHRSWGASVIGMTNMPEAKLAREAGISYATMAMCTDYDCWFEGHDDVTVEQVVKVLKANASLAGRVVLAAIPRIMAYEGPPPQGEVMSSALLTARDAIPESKREMLSVLLGSTED